MPDIQNASGVKYIIIEDENFFDVMEEQVLNVLND